MQSSLGRITTKGTSAYLTIEDWPATGTIVAGSLSNDVRAATLLATGQRFPVRRDGRRIIVEGLPCQASCGLLNVVRLELEETPRPQFYETAHLQRARCIKPPCLRAASGSSFNRSAARLKWRRQAASRSSTVGRTMGRPARASCASRNIQGLPMAPRATITLEHRGTPNRSDRTRCITQVRYAQRIIGHTYCPFMNYQMPEHVYADANPHLRRLLGFLPHGANG